MTILRLLHAAMATGAADAGIDSNGKMVEPHEHRPHISDPAQGQQEAELARSFAEREIRVDRDVHRREEAAASVTRVDSRAVHDKFERAKFSRMVRRLERAASMTMSWW
jgi:hypothetical protein